MWLFAGRPPTGGRPAGLWMEFHISAISPRPRRRRGAGLHINGNICIVTLRAACGGSEGYCCGV